MAGRHIEHVRIDSLKPALRNPKHHSDEDINKSIGRFGFVEPMILDERTGRMVAGHGRLNALRSLEEKGGPPPSGVKLDPSGAWLVPVVRGWASRSDQEAEAYLLASNQLTIAGGWQTGELVQLLKELDAAKALDGVGFTDAELKKLLEDTSGSSSTGDDEVQDLEPGAQLYVKSGDLWELGGTHRLLVGDSMSPEDMARLLGGEQPHLLATDPPYGVYGSSTGIGGDITDDKMVQPFYEKLAKLAFDNLPVFGHAYFFCDWRSWSALWIGARRSGLTCKNLLVWDKGGGGLGSCYAMAYELVGFFAKLPVQRTMKSTTETGQRMVHRPNLLRFSRPTGTEREHNAAKPVALMEEFIANSSDEANLVLEPFGGSGTTLIAAEKLGRRCCAMEMEPKFAQIILERFKRVTGKPVKKVE